MQRDADQLQRACVPVSLRPGEARDLTLYGVERPPVTLRGVVQDDRDRGLAGVRVSGAGRATSTGADGSFAIDVPARTGPTPLTFELDGYETRQVDVVAGAAQPVRLAHVELAATVQVVLVGLVEGALDGVRARLDDVGQVDAIAPGRFRADGLQPRVPYTLRVSRTGYPEVVRRFTLEPGASGVALEPVQLIHGSLLGTHALSARVVDPAGAPVPGAQVDVRLTEPTRRLPVATRSTGDDGRFSVPVAGDEAYEIVAAKPGYTFAPVVGQAPADGAGLMVGPSFVAELVLTPVPPGGTISVSVAYEFDWLPQDEPATVTLTRAGEALEPQRVAPAQGPLVFDDLGAGRYTVRIERPGFRAVVEEHTLDLNRRAAAVEGRLVLQDLAAARPNLTPGTVLPAADLRARGDRPPVRLVGARLAGLLLEGDFTALDLSEADLSGADLTGANLRRARLSRASLAQVNAQATRFDGAYLTGADLTAGDFTGAHFVGAWLDDADGTRGRFERAVFVAEEAALPVDPCAPRPQPREGPELDAARAWDGCRATLSEANLSGAVISGSNLTGANLSGSRLVGGDLSAACADDEVRCQQTSRFAQATFTQAQLPGMLVGSVDLTGACFRDADLTSIEFSKQAVFTAADFGGATLEGARMDEADLRAASFQGARMARAQLRSSDLDGWTSAAPR